MELLLNLAWLLLALPAYWLWRDCRRAGLMRRPSPWHCLLALGCMLVVLFPVISATDDLHAMRAEIEESPAGKHSFRQSSNERPSTSKWQSQPVTVSALNYFPSSEQAWHSESTPPHCTRPAHANLRPGRAPPAAILG